MALFPKSMEQVDQIAAEVARDIRSQYTIAFHSTKPSTEPGFRRVQVTAEAKGQGKLNVRTRTGTSLWCAQRRNPPRRSRNNRLSRTRPRTILFIQMPSIVCFSARCGTGADPHGLTGFNS